MTDFTKGNAYSNQSLKQCRALFISDVHLGYKDCRADFLLDLLDSVSFSTLYLVGDIVDIWSLKKRIYWPEMHQKLLTRLLELPNQGVRVVYIPGNHDEAMRKFLHLSVNHIEIYQEFEHQTNNGQKLLLLHGDAFDSIVCGAPLMGWLGDKLYDFLLFLTRWFNRIRRMFGKPYWSLASHIKQKVGKAQSYIKRYKQAATQFAHNKGYDGVVCGHIHQPDLDKTEYGVYANCGDWIESCTCLIENQYGDIELIHWADHKQLLTRHEFDNEIPQRAA